MNAPAHPQLVAELEVRGFRTVRHGRVQLPALCALVGDPEAGKSNLLAALRAVLDSSVEPATGDRTRDGELDIEIEARLASGARLTLKGVPPALRRTAGEEPPPLLYLPAAERAGAVLAPSQPPTARARRTVKAFRRALDVRRAPGHTRSALAVAAIEAFSELDLSGVVLLIEEPELYLRPQSQRFLYRVLRRLASGGNQVVYSTHSPAFLNAARLDEVVFVERLPSTGTTASRPAPLTPDEDFRVFSEFDAERSELLLSRAALLVEGLTEKLAFPFVFAALGVDNDEEGITIVECGGKSNIPLFADVCAAAGIPCVAVHDRDAPAGRRPRAAERINNALVQQAAGAARTVVVVPDFEGLSRLPRGTSKPEQAWRRFASLGADQMPEPLVRAARLALALARGAA